MGKREEILDAASECFNAYGYAKTSMSDIGKRVGMNKASLYYHFKDKISLYDEVLMKSRHIHDMNLSEKMAKAETFEDRVVVLLIHEIDFWKEVAISNQLTMNPEEKSETSRVSEKVVDKSIQTLVKIIEEGVGDGTIALKAGMTPQSIANMIFQISKGVLFVNCPLYLPRTDISEGYEVVKIMIEDIIRIFLKGI